jgi:hypothetical protein
MTTYTVFDAQDSSRIFGRGLTAEQAMHEFLTYDGYRYEIRKTATSYDLYHSDGSENSTRSARHMVKTVVFSLLTAKSDAIKEIAERVVVAGWDGPEIMTDEAFDAVLVEIEAE